jgi:hypothetical protein
MIFTNLNNVTNVTNYNNLAFFDANFINGSPTTDLEEPTLYTTFKALPEFNVKFDIL